MSKFLIDKYKGLSEYVPGEQPRDMEYIKLNTNESPFPPSPYVVKVISDAEKNALNLYPDPTGKKLREGIGKLYGLTEENIILANGSDEILSFIYIAFCGNVQTMVAPDISYGFYKVYAALYETPFEEIPLQADLTINAEQYTGIGKNIIIANPNSPTGTILTLQEVEAIVASNPENIVVIDEAYVDFGGESCCGLIGKYDNLIVVRTFSKSASLAGARLGFAMANEDLIKDLNKIKYSINPYNVNRLTLLAGEATLENLEYYKENSRTIIANREYTAKELKALGFTMTDSKANFLFAKSDKISGEELYLQLKKKGILVRHFEKAKISQYIRITIGSREQMEKFITAVKEVMKEREA